MVGVQTPIGPTSGGKVYAYNNLTVTPGQVAPANVNRTGITFHNPGTIAAYIAPALAQTSGASVALTPAVGSIGGCFLLGPGGMLTINGECSGAWQAFSASGSGNPLTVMESNV